MKRTRALPNLIRFLRRVTWALADQVVSSLRSFALGIVMAHQASPRVFGVFALAFGGFLIVLNISRSLLTTPLLLSQRSAEREGAVLVGSLLAGVIVALFMLPILITTLNDELTIALVLTVGLPGLLVQDSIRFIFLARGRPRGAAFNDGIFTAASLGSFFLLSVHDSGAACYLISWTISGFATGILTWSLLKFPFSIESLIRFLRDEYRVGLNLLAENLSLAVTGPLASLIVASFGTLDLVAANRAAYSNVLGPVSALVQGLQPQLLVMLRDYKGDAGRLFGHVLYAGALLLLLTVGGALGLLLLPTRVGFLLAGQTFELSRPLLIPASIAVGLSGGAAIGSACLRFYRTPEHMRNLRMFITAVSLGGLALGLAVGQLTGLIVATIAVSVLVIATVLGDLAIALHNASFPPLGRPGSPPAGQNW